MQAQQSSQAIIERFTAAFNRQELDAVMALMTDGCVFENTFPPPNGERAVGQQAVRAAFAAFFQSSPAAQFETEEIFALGDRAVMRWTYRWTNAGSGAGHVRGVDIYRIQDGKIAEKLSYVKG
jgi:ketosteroid isomerase-like protein